MEKSNRSSTCLQVEIAAIVTAGFDRAKNVLAVHSGDAPRNKCESDAAVAEAIDEAGYGRSTLRLNPPDNRYQFRSCHRMILLPYRRITTAKIDVFSRFGGCWTAAEDQNYQKLTCKLICKAFLLCFTCQNHFQPNQSVRGQLSN